MANTTSYCYQSVDDIHWQQPAGGPLSLAPPPVVPLLLQQEDQPCILQACALFAAAWSLTIFIPKPKGTQRHYKTLLLKWCSGTNLLLCTLSCIISFVTDGISVASLTNNLPVLSGPLVCQAFLLIRLTAMAWFIKQLYGSSNKTTYDHQQRRKISTSKQGQLQNILDFISKILDKVIIFAVLFASVILFFSSVLYLAVKPMVSWILKSGFYKSALNLVKQLTSQLTMYLSKHPLNKKLIVLVPTSLVISACVSSVQVLDCV